MIQQNRRLPHPQFLNFTFHRSTQPKNWTVRQQQQQQHVQIPTSHWEISVFGKDVGVIGTIHFQNLVRNIHGQITPMVAFFT